jgi:hypothetical protein
VGTDDVTPLTAQRLDEHQPDGRRHPGREKEGGEMKRSIGLLVVAVAALTAYFLGAAQRGEAIPNAQENCAFSFITTDSTQPAKPIAGTAVTVNNGTVARKVLVQFSGDTGVDTGGEVRISYKIDGGAPQEDVFGPANLANHQEFFEARTVIAVIPIGPGTHTITPFWRVSGVAGKNAFMDSRCFTAERVTS